MNSKDSDVEALRDEFVSRAEYERLIRILEVQNKAIEYLLMYASNIAPDKLNEYQRMLQEV